MLPRTAMRRNQRREMLVGPPATWGVPPTAGPCASCCATLPCLLRSSLVRDGVGLPGPDQVHAGAAERGADDRQDNVGREEAAEERDQPVAAVGAVAALDQHDQQV